MTPELRESPNPLTTRLEALLFAAGRAVSVPELAAATEAPEEEVRVALQALESSLVGRGVQLLKVAGGLRLATRPEHAEPIRRLLHPEPARLTPARLETLAIVAYRQPTTKAEVEAVRGVDCGATIRALLDLGLVELRGRRKDKLGHPMQYGTTRRFLEEFGLDALDDLPRLEELDQ